MRLGTDPADRPATEPRTEAGRRVLAEVWERGHQLDADDILAIEAEAASPALDVERLARAIQATILTTPDQFMGPGMGAYRQPWDEMADHEQRAVIRDAEALAAEYARLSQSAGEQGDTGG